VGAYFVSRLDTPELKESLLQQAKATLGTELKVKEMKISLLSGVTLKAIAVQNPAPFPGQLLTADAFVLRYRLMPLLAGRMEVERLALEKPALAIAMDTKGAFNYEKLGRAAAKGAPAAPGATTATATPLRVVMKSLAVENGSIVMTDYAKARLMTVDAIDFKSAFEVTGGIALGAGQVTIGKGNFGDVLFVKNVRAPLSMSKEKLTLSPIKGDVAGGGISGDLNVDLKGFRYTTQMTLKGASVKTLLEEARTTPFVTGTLSAAARFDGSGGLPTMRARAARHLLLPRAEQQGARACSRRCSSYPSSPTPTSRPATSSSSRPAIASRRRS
jgi:AsmA protein